VRVVLKQEVRGLGRPGDVKEVADGYAQNFLLPKGLAIEASAG
jgi:large subunit ribosomal protein L9